MDSAPELLERYHPKIGAVSKKDASLVLNRSKGICENCKRRRADVIHHLCGRRVKAWHGNLLHLCTSCHVDSKVGIHHNKRVRCRWGLWLQMLYFRMGFSTPEVRHLMGIKSGALYYVITEEEWKSLEY